MCEPFPLTHEEHLTWETEKVCREEILLRKERKVREPSCRRGTILLVDQRKPPLTRWAELRGRNHANLSEAPETEEAASTENEHGVLPTLRAHTGSSRAGGGGVRGGGFISHWALSTTVRTWDFPLILMGSSWRVFSRGLTGSDL